MKGARGVIISITGGEDMRLMEVDEAASHIKELVDPDANIIWGSAFNDDLEGKIRVSVVATGIDAEAVTQPQPAKVFTFPTRSPAPAAAAPAPELAPQAGDEEDEDGDDVLELTEEVGDSADSDDDSESEELLLEGDDILTSPVGAPPIAPPADEDEEAAAAGDDEAQEQRKAATGTGGTLFERMSNIARGAPKAQLDEPSDPGLGSEPLDIPRFLNRQNNQ